MALKVTVDSVHVESRSGVSKRNGKPFVMHTQAAWIHLVDPTGVPDRFPTKFRVTVDEAAKPYAVGTYVLPDSAISVNSWGDVEINFPKLLPLPQAVKAAA